MKKLYLYSALLAILCAGAASCSKDDIEEDSVIVDSTLQKNDFDRWLDAHFLGPYNIEFKYRYEGNESDLPYRTVPAEYHQAVKMAHLVKYICIDSFVKAGGTDFVKMYFPRMFYCIGTWEFNSDGTYTLGHAENGNLIMLAGVNYIDEVMSSKFPNLVRGNLKTYYLKTILHEFTHILNQTKKYPSAFAQVTPGYVLSDWANHPEGSVEHYLKGFITDYSMYSEEEDFAEMLSEYLLTSQKDWDAIKDIRYYTRTPDGSVTTAAIGDGDGFNLINAKLEIVRTYMKEVFSIDIEALRNDIQDRIEMIVKGYADLENLDN